MSDAGKSLVFDGVHEFFGGEPEDGAYWLEVLADGASFGDPQPVEIAVASLLRDGALTVTESNGNREVSFLVTVKSNDPVGLAQGVAALQASTQKRTTLRWQDDEWPATIFDVQTSSIVSPNGFDDLAYNRNEATLALRMVCLPFTRSEDSISDDAGSPPTGEGTLLYSAESTTGWSYTRSSYGSYTGDEIVVDTVVFTEGTGSVRAEPTTSVGYAGNSIFSMNHSLRVAGLSLDTDTGGYLAVSLKAVYEDIRAELFRLHMTTAENGKVEVEDFYASTRDENGFVRYAWPVDPSLTVTDLWLEHRQDAPRNDLIAGQTAYLWVDNVRLLDTASTDYQVVKQIEVKGSARTDASLRVSATSDSLPLGQVLIATVPSSEVPQGFTPDARKWVSSGTTTADTDAPSGSYFNLGSGYTNGVFDMPADLFTPGAYTAVMICKPASGTITPAVQAQLLVDGVEVGVTSSASVALSGQATTGYQFIPLGTVILPPTPVLFPSADVKVRIKAKGENVRLDNVLFLPAWQVGGRPVAAFSIVDCGTGTVEPGGSSSRLWIDSPSPTQPRGGWWRGGSADRSNAQSAWQDVKKPGDHVFPPGDLTIIAVSLETTGLTVGIDYFPRWYGLAAL